jgi:autotransporter-associated beta strand protein
MELGGDNKDTVTLSAGNTYTGGTSILAGTLVITDDTSLGAAPTETNAAFNASLTPNAAGVPTNVLAAVQADNGIIFNSLTEGNGTLTIGTTAGGGTATFTSAREIAVGSEEATINLNGHKVTLTGELISLGTNSIGIGNAAGYSDLTIDDNSSNNGVLFLSTPSPDFWGNLIIGNTNAPTVNVSSDLAMGNTLANNAGLPVGQVELNGGTLQAGANFSATDRNLFLGGGSSFDVNGFATSWGTLNDIQRTLTVENSSTTGAGSATFASFAIGSTAILAVDAGTGTAGGKGTVVTFTGGITRNGNTDAGAPANATLFIDPSAGSTLGSAAANGVEVFSSGASATLTDGIAPVWIITDSGAAATANPYDFVTYSSATGYAIATYTTAFGAGNVVKSSGGSISSSQAYALNLQNGKTLTIASGNTLTIGDGADPAGLILEGTAAINGGTLAFGASEAVVDVKATDTIASAVTGTGGLTLSGSGTLVLSGTAGGLSGPIIVDSGTLQLSTANYFNPGTTVWLSNVKSKPSNSILAINANETLSALNADATSSNSAITIANGDTLTIGDTTNNFSSTLPSKITATGSGSLIKAGSGMLDLSSSGGVSFATGSITVQGGVLRIGNGVFATTATTAINLAAGTELQYSGNGGSAFNDPITGAGEFHLVAGTVKLTSTTNSYSGGTVIEIGATLDITTANLPTINENITDAGGTVLFDQATSGTFTGVISDGQEMGTGAMESGTLIKDDSTGSNGGNVTIADAQTYTGATYVEAGTLTLSAVNAVADSSGVTLGRVGGGATAILALGASNTLASLSSDASNTTSVVLDGNVLTLDPGAAASSDFGGTIVNGTAAGSLVVEGAGTTDLTGTDTFSGGTTIEAGTLELGNAQAAGSGAIAFAPSVGSTLKIDLGDAPANQITGFAIGDKIDLLGVGTETTFSYVGGVLTLAGGSQGVALNVGALPAHEGFVLSSDGTGGTLVSAATDNGPAITAATPSVVEQSQTTVIGTVAAGLAGDTLTLHQIGGSGTLSLGAVVNGVQQVIYTAPASIAASGLDNVSYTVSDEYNNVATGSSSVPVDIGPKVTSVTALPASGVEVVGQAIELTVVMNEGVTVAGGTPVLFLNDGGTAIYDAAATGALGDPTRLVFDYTVGAADQNVNALAIVGGSTNGATIADMFGLTPNYSNLLTTLPGLAIAVDPTVVSVTPSTAPGIKTTGQSMTFTVTMSEAVTVSGGTPALALNDGGTASYDAGATAALGDPTKLVFDYTVGAGDQNVATLAIVSASLDGAAITDAAGRGAVAGPDLLTSFAGISVATSTVLESITASPASGTENPGDTITFTLTMNNDVTVSGGIPTLALNDSAFASYDPTATAALGDPTKLVFTYTVSSNDQTVSTLAITGGSLNGATILDAQGHVPSFNGLVTSFPGLGVDPPPAATATNADQTALPPGIDLTSILFGAQTTLAYAPNQSDTGGTLTVSDGTHNAAIALLGQYMAGDFHTASDFHGGTLVTDPSLTGAPLAAFVASSHT